MGIMTTRYRVHQLEEVLSDLCRRVEGIEQAVVVSLEGFVVASHPPAVDEGADSPLHSPTIAATAANAIALGTRTLGRLEHGEFERLIMEGQSGAMIIYPIVGADAALVTIIRKDTKMGLASRAMRLSVGELAAILSPGANQER
jgi:predicted regulator of Ras-like GTPase activity (Roadblock/LC7/MglB family)